VWRTLIVAAAALAVAATPGFTARAVLDRSAVLDGEVWRLFTGHLVHGSTSHLLWDVLPLLAVGLLFERSLGSRYWIVLGASSLSVASGVLAMEPDLARYCGLSGVLNGLWVAGALNAARTEETSGAHAMAWIYRACVVGDLLKIAFEAFTGTPILTEAASLGVIPVPLAHALGALAGVLCLAGPCQRWKKMTPARARATGARTASDGCSPWRPGPATWWPHEDSLSAAHRRRIRAEVPSVSDLDYDGWRQPRTVLRDIWRLVR
jgi:rhomboid family GlyGly-CTERM serine protease